MEPPERPPVELIPTRLLLAHEETVPARVEELVRVLRRDGLVRLAIVADAKTRVVLDGHHRLAALKVLGCKRVPVLLVDYHRGDIRVATWRQGERPPSKDEVLRQAEQGKLYPPKSTRHFFPWKFQEQAVALSDLQHEGPGAVGGPNRSG